MVDFIVGQTNTGDFIVRTGRGGSTRTLTRQQLLTAVDILERSSSPRLALAGEGKDVSAFGGFVLGELGRRQGAVRRDAFIRRVEASQLQSLPELRGLTSEELDVSAFRGEVTRGFRFEEIRKQQSLNPEALGVERGLFSTSQSRVSSTTTLISPTAIPLRPSQSLRADVEMQDSFFGRVSGFAERRGRARAEVAGDVVGGLRQRGQTFLGDPLGISSPTRQELIGMETERQLDIQFQGLTPAQLRGAAGVEGSGIFGQSTAEGERFIFQPNPLQLAAARGRATVQVGDTGLDVERRVGALRGVTGLTEQLLSASSGMALFEEGDRPSAFGGTAFGFGKLVEETPFVQEIRTREIGREGRIAEIGTGVAIPAAVGFGFGAGAFASSRAAGLTRAEAAGELILGSSPIQTQRTFTPSITGASRFDIDVGQVTIGKKGGRFQVIEGVGVDQPDIRFRTFSTGKAELDAGVTFVERPFAKFTPDLTRGKLQVGTETEAVLGFSFPKSAQFESTGFLKAGRSLDVGVNFPESVVQRGVAQPFINIKEFTELPSRARFIQAERGFFRPPTTRDLIIGRTKPQKESAEFGGLTRVEAEQFGIGAGQPLIRTAKDVPLLQRSLLQTQQPKFSRAEGDIFAQFRGRGRAIEISPIEPTDDFLGGLTVRRGGRGGGRGRPSTTTDQVTKQLADLGKQFSGGVTQAGTAVSGAFPPINLFPTTRVSGLGLGATFTRGDLFQGVSATSSLLGGIRTTAPRPTVDLLSFDAGIPAGRVGGISAPLQPSAELEKSFQPQIARVRLSSNLLEDSSPVFATPLATTTPLQAPLDLDRILLTPRTPQRTRQAQRQDEFFPRAFEFRFPRTPRGRGGFGLPAFFPPLSLSERRGRARKGKRRFRRVPSLAASEFGITVDVPSELEFTGLVERPIIRRKKRKKGGKR